MTVIYLWQPHMTDFEFFKNYVSSIRTEFKVNREAGVVTCIITTTEDFLKKIIKYGFAEPFEKIGIEIGAIDTEDADLDVRKYVGIARCSPEDVWDETFGRQLAEYRAMKARKDDLNARIKAFVRRTYNNLDNLWDYGLLKEPHKPQERD